MFSKILQRTLHSCRLTSKNVFSFAQKKPSVQNLTNDPKLTYLRKRSTYLNIAMTCFMFAACFAAIPLYRTFCEHMGLSGDYEKKEYNFVDYKINNLKKYKVIFTGESDPDVKWQFQPVQREVMVSAGETAIIFYRLYNKEEKPIVGFATYNISPEDCNVYFSKIQCFCFNQQLINPKEELLLPIFFYLEPEINDDISTSRINEISVAYTFLKSAKQNLAKFAEDQLRKVEQNKRKLNQIRSQKMGMTIDEYLKHLQEKEVQQSIENEQLKQTELRRLEEEEQQERLKRDFQEDMIKAELISQQFTPEHIYGSPRRSGAVA